MLVYILVDHKKTEYIDLKEVQREDVLEIITNTPAGNTSYVIDISGDIKLSSDFKYMNYDEVMEILEITEREGMLVAKYNNDILE